MVKDKITLNVLADITKKTNRDDIGDDVVQSTDRVLVVFTGSNIDLSERIEELKEIKAKGKKISLAFSFMADKMLNVDRIINSLDPVKVFREENVFQLEDIIREHGLLIGVNTTMNTLSKVSLGMVDSLISNIIWTFLYRGKPVYLDYSSVRNCLGVPTENKGIDDIIENYIDRLNGLGVVELRPGNYIKDIFNNGSNINSNDVITERDILGFGSNKSLKLPRGTIITPLARDRAKELGITVEIEG